MNQKLLLSVLLLISLLAMMRVVRARRGGDIIILGTGGHGGGHGHHGHHEKHHHHHDTHQTHYLPVPVYLPCNCGHDYGHVDYSAHSVDYNGLGLHGYKK